MTALHLDQLDRVTGGFFRLEGVTRGQKIVNAIGTVAAWGTAIATGKLTLDAIHRKPHHENLGD